MIKQAIKDCNLPDLFAPLGVNRDKTVENWKNICVPYWKNIIEEQCFGKRVKLECESIKKYKNEINFAGKVVWETVEFTFCKNGKTHVVPTQLVYPAGATNCPFVIVVDRVNQTPSPYIPVEEITDMGFGIFSVGYKDITSDNGDFEDGICALFGGGGGKISYWSSFASFMLDYLEKLPFVNKKAIGVAGHSRRGKTALYTAAFDERFSFVLANNSGTTGAALARYKEEGIESVQAITKTFPYWFSKNYLQYANNEQAMPFDHHCLIALVAPRVVCIGTAVDDVWANNNGQLLALVEASKVWKLYGEDGLDSVSEFAKEGTYIDSGSLTFHQRKGKHYFSRQDWHVYLDAIKRKLL